MTLVEWITFGGTMAAVSGIFVGFHALINNRAIRSKMAATRMLPEEFEQGRERIAQSREEFKGSFAESIKYLGDLIVADGDKTRRTIRQS